MHGDFASNQIVFTETDYLDFPFTNPFFENILRFLMSTTTVLFLGYSYNDINLKNILRWSRFVGSNSPKYLLENDSHEIRRLYLDKNHNIKVINPINTKLDVLHGNELYKNLYNALFKHLLDDFYYKDKYSLFIYKEYSCLDNNEKLNIINYFTEKLKFLDLLNYSNNVFMSYIFPNSDTKIINVNNNDLSLIHI